MRLHVAALAAVLLAGCAGAPPSPGPAPGEGLAERRIEKAGHRYSVTGDSVRIEGVGFFPLLRETADALYVAIAQTPSATSAPIAPPSATPSTPASFAAPASSLAQFVRIDQDAPRRGQWREAFALHDLDGDGTQELIAAPPRKQSGAPLVFALQRTPQALVFSRRPQHFPSRAWDYGAVAAGDFDGDGRSDLAFGMHLTAIAAALARDDQWTEASNGLPGSATGPRGSAIALATRAGAPRDTLLALAEFGALPGAPDAPRFRGLVEFGFDDTRWQLRETIDAGVVGRGLVQARDARCGEKLAVASASADGARLWQRRDDGWQERSVPHEPALRIHAAAVALGDFDADGCSDLAVAGAHFDAGAWYATLWVHLDRGERWESRLLERAPGRATFTALAAAPAPGSGTALLAGTQEGELRAYDARMPEVRRIATAAVPHDLRGCSVRRIAVLGDDLVVAWAGEPTLDRPGCHDGGGLGAYAWQ